MHVILSGCVLGRASLSVLSAVGASAFAAGFVGTRVVVVASLAGVDTEASSTAFWLCLWLPFRLSVRLSFALSLLPALPTLVVAVRLRISLVARSSALSPGQAWCSGCGSPATGPDLDLSSFLGSSFSGFVPTAFFVFCRGGLN